MNFKTLTYFLAEFHSGAVNIFLHLCGLLVAIYALLNKNYLLVLLAPIISESGHLYNFYFRKISYPKNLLTLLVTQLIAYLLLVLGIHLILGLR